ncbi:MAG: hypothetical protein ACYTBS_18965 [Planctomycetota bacterium]|jgi:hypothetical protein
MPKKKYDTSEPILVIIRRGRRGRGFTVAPVEDASNPAMCGSKEELGEVLEEMLDDEHQPRVDINQLLAAASGEDPLPQDDCGSDDGAEDPDEEYEDGDEDEEYEDDDEEPAGEGGIFEGVAGSEDPADRLLFNLFSAAVTKGRDMSSKPRKPRSRRRRRRTKTSKSKSR